MSAPSPTEKPLRLLALFPQLLGHGGVQEAGRQTALALDELSRRYSFSTEFLSLNDPRAIHSFALGGRETSIRAFGRSKLSFVFAVLRAERSLDAGGPRVVLAFHPNLALPASWAAFLSPGTKLAVVAHGVDAWQPLPAFRRRALQRADLALAPSQFTCEQLHAAQGVAREKIRLLPWALPPEVLALVNSSEKLSLPPHFPHGRVILAVGRWAASERYKGADDLIFAVAQIRTSIPDLHLVLVGDGDDLPRLQQLAKTTGASAITHFLRGISNEALAACYSQAEIFALPSSGEGFGFVFLEAMAFRKPIIAAAAGGATDIVRHEVNGLLVAPGDLVQLIDSLTKMLGDDRLRERLGRRGEEIAHTDFSFSNFTSHLEGLLRESDLLG
jgi:phosphatidyl-myo-inositol dimannoside synthase